MIELKGKYNKDCKIFIDDVENEAISTIYSILDEEVSKDVPIRIMPDVHEGKGIVIGFTMPLTEMINPEHVGVDIGCGVIVAETDITNPNLELINSRILQIVPLGEKINTSVQIEEKTFISSIKHLVASFVNKYNNMYNTNYPVPNITEKYISNLCDKVHIEEGKFWKSIGSLGGGNHYIELNQNAEGKIFINIHSGSRNFGLKVCKYHTSQAKKQINIDQEEYTKAMDNIRMNTPDDQKHTISQQIKTLKESYKMGNSQKYLKGDFMFEYLLDMVIAQAYANVNRQTMLSNIIDKLGCRAKLTCHTIHNYVDFDHWMVRKGAISADLNETCVIPMNMRDGILICKGKGNPDWNYSAPHGAGRIFSRSRAKREVTLEEFTESMKGIYSSCINNSTIDESPMVYKDMNIIMQAIDPTVEILDVIKPILNIKASE